MGHWMASAYAEWLLLAQWMPLVGLSGGQYHPKRSRYRSHRGHVVVPEVKNT